MTIQIIAWVVALFVLAAGLAVSLVSIRFERPRFALLAAIPVVIGLLGVTFRVEVPAPDHAVAVIGGLLVALLGVVAGNPITTSVLAYSGRGSAHEGKHGGIVIDDTGTFASPEPEVLRGGTIIGYVERLVLIVAVILGRLEIVVVLVAIKGLGRFTELDRPEVRERFIIGTLVSLVWAGACALLVVL